MIGKAKMFLGRHNKISCSPELIIPHYFNSHQQLDNPFPKWNKSYKIKKLKENTKTTFISPYICHNLYS